MELILKNATVIDPLTNFEGKKDIAIRNGKIDEVGNLKSNNRLDLTGCYIFPSLFDLHTHLREPGYESSETICTGIAAASHGGYGTICAMPNSNPPNDSALVMGYLKYKIEHKGCRVLPIGAISAGLEGKSLSDMYSLKDEGAIAYSDDGNSVYDAGLLKRAMMIAKSIDMPLFLHEEDKSLSSGGVMREGAVSARLGLCGISSSAESSMIARDIEIARETGARVHFCHISCRRSIELIKDAKSDGMPVTCEVTPHHLSFTDEDVGQYDTNAKVNPPLPSISDRDDLINALIAGDIDAVATDHAPHALDLKARSFQDAPFGISGIETALPLLFTRLVKRGRMSFMSLLYKMIVSPAKIAGFSPSCIKEREVANLVIFKPLKFKVLENFFLSKGKNSPLIGKELTGEVFATLFHGKFSYRKADGII